jgi:hypothetical protein
VVSRSDHLSEEERGELVVSSPTSPDRLVGACQAAMAYYNGFPETRVVLLSLRPLRSHVANDKRSLPQSAQSARREKGNPLFGESSGVVLGLTVRSWSMGP